MKMSDFASMLASFKSNTAAPVPASSLKPSTLPQSTSTVTQQPPRSTTRKRPCPDPESDANNNILARKNPGPSFPSMHESVRNRQAKYGRDRGFELSFMVIGAQKAGTSWIHSLLKKCSHARISLPVEQKEVHFWDWHYRKGFQWYMRQFDYPRKKLSTQKDTTGGTDKSDINETLYGEITPCYIVLPPSTISEIFNCFPQLKLIFIARDMVDRVWSAMIMELRDQSMGRNPGEFAADVGVPGSGDARRTKGTSSTNSVMSLAQRRRLQQQSSPSSQSDSYFLERLRSETHSSRSDYATHLRNWYAHFPSKNILLIDYREIETNPRGVLIMILIHIGIEEDDASAHVGKLHDEDVRQRVNAATTNTDNKMLSSSSSQELLSERPNLKKQIQEHVRPFAVDFNLMLKDQGYTWRLSE